MDERLSAKPVRSLKFGFRVNIGNAAVFNLQKDLKLKNVQFNTALTIFFVPYILFEIPSNIILRRVRPNIWCMSGLIRHVELKSHAIL